MSCGTMSLLVKVTRPPTATVASNGRRPNGVMETRASFDGDAGDGAGAGAGSTLGDGDGAGSADGAGALDEPQPARITAARRHDPRTRMVRGSYRTC